MTTGERLPPGIGTEMAAEMYVDDILDGQGQYLFRGILTKDNEGVTLDRPRSVSGMIRFDEAEESDGCDVEPTGETPSSVVVFWEGGPDE